LLVRGWIRRSCGYFRSTSSSRNEATLPSTAVRWLSFVFPACFWQVVAFSAGGDGGRKLPELQASPVNYRDSSVHALRLTYENRVGRIAANAMSAKRTHRTRGSTSILRSNSIAIIGTAMIA
jgi:hypothetical protein